MLNYEEALEYISSTYTFGEKIGLENITILLSYLGNPHKDLKYVHIAGTNGKGSTSAMTANVLLQSGVKAGLYISPYLEDFRERIQFDGQLISKEDLIECTQTVKDAVDRMMEDGYTCPSEFEIVTTIAFVYYRKVNAEIVVTEVGMGGRFDATNVIPNAEAAAIVSISFDHMQYLGNTLADIAFEKSGIIKEGYDVSIYAGIGDDIYPVFEKAAAARHATLYRNDIRDIEFVSTDIDGQTLRYVKKDSVLGIDEFRLALLGEHQRYNVLNVLNVCEILKKKGWPITPESLKAALATVRFTGRFEILCKEPVIFIDGGHNIEGITAFVNNVGIYFPDRKLNLFFGMLSDKQVEESLQLLVKVAKRMYTLTPDDKRAVEAPQMAANIARLAPDMPVIALDSVKDAGAYIDFSAKDEIYAFTGSLYMIGEARTELVRLIKENQEKQ